MQINITGQQMDVTPALREYAQSKFQRLERHFDQITRVHVILSVEKERHKAEATVSVIRGELFADTVEESMYAAIDELMDKLDRQLKKHKEKLTDHHRSEGGIKSQGL